MNIENTPSSCESSLCIRAKLEKIFKTPSVYLDFPKIPQGIIANNGLLRQDVSICKKGTAYYIIDDSIGEYTESLNIIDQNNILFMFTAYEIDSHIGLRVDRILNEDTDIMTLEYEKILSDYVHGRKALKTPFPKNLCFKINELSYDIKPESCEKFDTFFPIPWVLERITLEKLSQGIYYVLGTEIDFTSDELEQLKKN